MLVIERQALEQLAALLLERTGLKIGPDGYHGLRLALTARMPALGIADAGEYVRRLRQLAGEHELRSLLPLVTVGKTDFFRDPRQFEALERKVLPDMLNRARREFRNLRIWSAGCATGEEPYSVAMLLHELGAKPYEAEIWATDLNPAAVEAASNGRFPHRRMAGVDLNRMQRYFTRTDDGYAVVPELKEFIRFEGQNLAAPVFHKVSSGSLDLILCRNVIIYFDLPTIRGLMDRFLGALRPGGLLFLGYSESLFKVYDRFEMIEVEGAFVYRRPTQPQTPRVPPLSVPPPAKKPTPATGTPVASIPRTRSTELPASIPPATQPIRARTGEIPIPGGAPTASATPVERLAHAVKLIDKGDFGTALKAVQKLTDDEPNDLDAQLTLGNLYSLLGKNDEALEVFGQVLAREPLCVEGHVFSALASLQAAKVEDARSELNKALFLEPTLAIGHYLLAQVHERAQDLVAARRSYRNVIAQLRFNQRPLAGHYPDMPESVESLNQAARYALAALEEAPEGPA